MGRLPFGSPEAGSTGPGTGRGWLAAKRGWRSSVEEIDARLAGVTDPSMQMLVETARARLAAGLGERDRAIEWLERSRARGMVRTAVGNDMQSDPFYDDLRGDPRFERINRGE